MNEITLSTQMTLGRAARLSVKIDTEALGLDWNANDIIRVMSYKSDGTIILKKVGKKVAKTVCHTLTSTGGGNFAHNLGIFISHRPKRFRSNFKPATTVSAGARFVDTKKTLLQIFMPRDIFEGEKCLAA